MELREKKIEPVEANSISYQARAITAVVKLELQISKAINKKPGKHLVNFAKPSRIIDVKAEPQMLQQSITTGEPKSLRNAIRDLIKQNNLTSVEIIEHLKSINFTLSGATPLSARVFVELNGLIKRKEFVRRGDRYCLKEGK